KPPHRGSRTRSRRPPVGRRPVAPACSEPEWRLWPRRPPPPRPPLFEKHARRSPDPPRLPPRPPPPPHGAGGRLLLVPKCAFFGCGGKAVRCRDIATDTPSQTLTRCAQNALKGTTGPTKCAV